MKKLKLIIFTIIFLGANTMLSIAEIKKSVTNLDRYKNVSTEMSAIKVILRDTKSKEKMFIIVGNKIFYNYLRGEKSFTLEQYVKFMEGHSNKPIEIQLDKLKNFLGGIHGVKKGKRLQETIKKYYMVDKELSLRDVDVNTEQELLEKYFDFDYNKGTGYLKLKFYNEKPQNQITSSPNFVNLLLNIGYEVTWDCFSGVLRVSTRPFIEIGGKASVW